MNRFLRFALCGLGFAGSVHAQTTLMCNGTAFLEGTQGQIRSESYSLNLQERSLNGAFGPFQITSITQRTLGLVTQGQTKNGIPLRGTGSLDRFTGNLSVYWFRAEESEKLAKGQAAHFDGMLNLTCIPAQKMF